MESDERRRGWNAGEDAKKLAMILSSSAAFLEASTICQWATMAKDPLCVVRPAAGHFVDDCLFCAGLL